MRNNTLKRMIMSALFLALAYVLPFITGQIPEIGSMLLPMHLPVLLCGFVCGWEWGFCVGFTAPLIRSLTLGMPPLFPTALCMAFELATYGTVAGMAFKAFKGKKLYIYPALIAAMLAGRAVWGAAMVLCMGIDGGSFTYSAFVAGAFTNAIPGIIVQLVLVPPIVMLLRKKVTRTP